MTAFHFQSTSLQVGICIFLSIFFSTFGEDAVPNIPRHATIWHQRRQVSFESVFVNDVFVDNSVLTNILPQVGVEDTATYRATYNVSYLETGIVALAPSRDLIVNVACGSRSNDSFIEIEFSNSVKSSNLTHMFPESSVLAVDGEMFGKCDVWATGDDLSFSSGFLIIREAVLETPNIVNVTGDPAFFNYLFRERDIFYETHEGGDLNLRHQRRNLVTFVKKKKFLKGELVEIDVEMKITPTVDFKNTRDYWRLTGDHWLDYDPYVDFYFELDAELTVETEIKASMKVEETLWEKRDEISWLNFPIPGLGYQLPSGVAGIINKVLPDDIQVKAAVGVSVAVPFVYDITFKTTVAYWVKRTGKSSTGKKEIDFGVRGRPPFDLSFPLSVNGEDPTGESKVTTNLGEEPDVELELTILAGVRPQLVLDVIGLAEASIGTTVGLEAKATLFNKCKDPQQDPGWPTEYGICHLYHHLQVLITAIILRNIFFRYSFLGGDPKTTDLAEFEIIQDLALICLIEANCSAVPSDVPSYIPSDVPSDMPTYAPSDSVAPSNVPSDSIAPSDKPSISNPPSASQHPSAMPTESPGPSPSPSSTPSLEPSPEPSASPTPGQPSALPTLSPEPSPSPSASPSSSPPFCHEPDDSTTPVDARQNPFPTGEPSPSPSKC